MAQVRSRKGNQEKIIQAALSIFAEEGYHGASIRKIADACDLNVPSIYYHFKNKAELFRVVLFYTHDQAMAEIRDRLTENKDLGGEILSIFDAILRHHEHNPERTRIIFRMVYSAPDEICGEYSETRGREFRELIRKAFKRNPPRKRSKQKLNCITDTLESFLLSLSFPNQKTNRRPLYRRTIFYLLEN